MILFVGDKPSKRTDHNVPFKGAACESRLMEWIGELAHKSYYEIVNRVDSDFFIMVNIALATDSTIIALGNNAFKALHDAPHFKLPAPFRQKQTGERQTVHFRQIGRMQRVH